MHVIKKIDMSVCRVLFTVLSYLKSSKDNIILFKYVFSDLFIYCAKAIIRIDLEQLKLVKAYHEMLLAFWGASNYLATDVAIWQA